MIEASRRMREVNVGKFKGLKISRVAFYAIYFSYRCKYR